MIYQESQQVVLQPNADGEVPVSAEILLAGLIHIFHSLIGFRGKGLRGLFAYSLPDSTANSLTGSLVISNNPQVPTIISNGRYKIEVYFFPDDNLQQENVLETIEQLAALCTQRLDNQVQSGEIITAGSIGVKLLVVPRVWPIPNTVTFTYGDLFRATQIMATWVLRRHQNRWTGLSATIYIFHDGTTYPIALTTLAPQDVSVGMGQHNATIVANQTANALFSI